MQSRTACSHRKASIPISTCDRFRSGTSMNIYVGNLPWSAGDQELEDLFAPFGTVQRARVILDRETGRSRGFGFVEMDDDGARKAIDELNGKEIDGRALRINEAQERESRH